MCIRDRSYTVTDPDEGQMVTVVEKIDSKQKRSFTATSGQGYSLNVTAAEWTELLNGSHTISITATDSENASSVRTYTFSKNESKVEFTQMLAMESAEMCIRDRPYTLQTTERLSPTPPPPSHRPLQYPQISSAGGRRQFHGARPPTRRTTFPAMR